MSVASPFKFPCPVCAQRIAALPEDIGTTGGCPGCGSQFIVPAPAEAAEAQPAPPVAKKGLPRWVVIAAVLAACGAALALAVVRGVLPFRKGEPPPVPAAPSATSETATPPDSAKSPPPAERP